MVHRRLSLFTIINGTLFVLLATAMLYPFWHTLMGSLMGHKEYMDKTLFLYPSRPSLAAYKLVLQVGLIQAPMRNTILITAVGSIYSLFVTAYSAYGLSKRIPGATLTMYLIVFTMFFHGGLIPSYIIYRKLGLINNVLVYILPMTINSFNLIVMRTYFQGFAKEIEEAAVIDGCGQFGLFFRIVLPLSKPILATIGLFFAVSYWNTFFASLFFINDTEKRTLQDYLYRIIRATDPEDLGMYNSEKVFIEAVKLANIILVVAPIILLYPFLQKYFVKGIMIGAVKG